jgi:hypothetical protein
VSKNGSSVELTALSGGSPYPLIIGPDSSGGFQHAGTCFVNKSVTEHQPGVAVSAIFTIDLNGVNSSSKLSNVVFPFGSGADSTVTGLLLNLVPEPSSLVIGSSAAGLLGLTAILRRRRHG